MTVSVMVVTRNRLEELRITCARLRDLQPSPDEVVICTDGCTDGSAAMVRAEFLEFRLVEGAHSMGSVYCRDRVLRLARGEIVVSLDDDSHPVQSDFVARVRQVFGEHPEAAVIVFPELRDGNSYAAGDKTDRSQGHYVSAYANCAAAMRREFYLKQPGFPQIFGHMYEEPDYALQCYAAGAAVWFEPSLVIRHRKSNEVRELRSRHHWNARNELWSVWLRCPWPWLPLVSAYRIARQIVYAGSRGWQWAAAEPAWWFSALKGLPQCARIRQPVGWFTYARWVRLARKPIYSRQELMSRFRWSANEQEPARSGGPT
jgi:GT2 family glycosyltransferase